MTRLALLCATTLLTAGCMTGTLAKGQKSELAEILRAAGKDQATWCMTVNLMTPWGSEKSTITRTGLLNGSVACTDSGLNVTAPAR